MQFQSNSLGLKNRQFTTVTSSDVYIVKYKILLIILLRQDTMVLFSTQPYIRCFRCYISNMRHMPKYDVVPQYHCCTQPHFEYRIWGYGRKYLRMPFQKPKITYIHWKMWFFYTWWRHQMETFLRYWPSVRWIHWSPLNSPHKGM